MTTDDLYRCGSCGRFWHKDEEPPTCQAVICPKVKCQPVAIQIKTTPAIPAERRTSIPDGRQPKPMEPVAQRARLRLQVSKLAIALRQIVWLADSEQPLSVKAGQIASEALSELGDY